jgi:transcriptional regulator with XRE-family HTH domain
MGFPERLRELRSGAKLSQKELGAKLGLSDRTIQGYELGKSSPTGVNLQKIATFFDVKMETLLDDRDLFLMEAKEKHGAAGRRSAKELVDELGGMYAGGKLSEDDMEHMFSVFTEMYFDAKERNKKYGRKKKQTAEAAKPK